jgi:hypothetical protein
MLPRGGRAGEVHLKSEGAAGRISGRHEPPEAMNRPAVVSRREGSADGACRQMVTPPETSMTAPLM